LNKNPLTQSKAVGYSLETV